MNWILDFFASLSIFFIPVILGSFFGGTHPQRFLKGAFVVGVLAFLALFPVPLSYEGKFATLVSSFSLISLGKMLFSRRKSLPKNAQQTSVFWGSVGILFTLYAAYLFFGLFKGLTPYPYHTNWDVYEHVKLSQEILTGKIHLFPSMISDTFTFNGYTPLFHLLLSLPTALFKASQLGVYYFAEWWFYLTVVLSSIAISFKVFHHRLQALLGGIFGATVFVSAVVYMPLFLLPQSATALLTVLLFFFAKHETKGDLIRLFLSCIVLFLMHFVVGFVGALIVLLWHLYQFFKEKYALLRSEWVVIAGGIGALLAVLGTALLHLTGGFQLTGREEAAYYQFGFSQLAHFFFTWYGVVGIVLLPIGLYVLLRSVVREHKLLALLSLIIFAVCFSPLSYVLKFFSIGFFFMNLILVAGVSRVLHLIPQRLTWVGVGVIAVVMTSVFYSNQALYKQFLYHYGVESHVSKLEMDAGKFLQSKEKVFLLSDPATQGILEAVGIADSQGGVYMNEKSRRTLAHLPEIDAADTKELLTQIQDEVKGNTYEKRYLVLSGRYFAWLRLPEWQKQSFYFNIWKARTLSNEDKEVIQQYLDAGLTPVYANEEMVILEI